MTSERFDKVVLTVQFWVLDWWIAGLVIGEC
jgi:hypothetical protein